MIKMYIDDEEVISDKEFTITEEMLNTSSTILNNCFPKKWELTKDYTSRFYYPLDYSKCKIENVFFNPEDIQIIGKCEQEEIPTPELPTPIITYTGDITYNILGKDYKINLGDIELCKINDKKDKIYKDNGKWYLEKNIDKYILTGQESWSYYSGVFYSNVTFEYLKNNLNTTISTHYKGSNNVTSASGAYNNGNNTIELFNSVSSSRIYLRDDRFSRATDFKNWLVQNNVILYYQIANPIITEITDENLINQLESLGRELIFCGVVKNTGDISLNPREPHYCSLQILDFKTLLSEGETLDFVISEKTIEEAIYMVVEAVSGYGIVVGDINILNGDDIIGAYSTLDKTAYDVLQYLADISQSKWTTRTINENIIAVDFYDPTLMPIGTPIENTTEFYEENEIIDISFSYGTRDYRNKQVILSDEVYGSIDYTETIITTGYTRDFITDSNIALIKSIKVNGIEKTFTTDDRKEVGVVADFYYTKGRNTFNSSSDDPIYSAGSTISIQYTPLVQGRQVVYNNIEVSRINNQLGRKGVIARYENRNDILNSDELQKVGQTYLKYKGSAEITLKVQTKDNDLYNIGQIVHYNAPLQELSTDYMVKKKERQIISVGNTQYIFYTYEMNSNYNSENAVNYFDNQRNKSNGNISQGEYISRNIDIENTANIIFYDLEINEIQIEGDNILDSILESPFNN